MKSITRILALVLAGALAVPVAMAQSSTTPNTGFQVKLESVGLRFGMNNPSFEYYNRTFWDFPQAMGILNADVDIKLHPNLHLQGGVGYGSFSSSVFRGEAFGVEEKLRYSFVPISASLLPRANVGKVDVFAGPTVDFVLVSANYTSRSFDTTADGNTMLYGGTLGANYRITPGLSLTVQGRYMIGEFDKVMVFNADQAEIVEVVDMTGPQISVGVKFRL